MQSTCFCLSVRKSNHLCEKAWSNFPLKHKVIDFSQQHTIAVLPTMDSGYSKMDLMSSSPIHRQELLNSVREFYFGKSAAEQ